jgi:hypothetical protein
MNETNGSAPTWRRCLAYLTIALMPLSWNVEKLVEAKDATYRSPFDFLLPLLAVLMLVDIVRRQPWVRFRLPSLPAVVWPALAVLSVVWVENFPMMEVIRGALRGMLNPVFFALVAVWVFQNLPVSRADEPAAAGYRRVTLVLGASFTVCVLIALHQYASPIGLPYNPSEPQQDLGGINNFRVAGWYDYRAVFGTLVAMLAPAAVAFALLDKDTAVRWSAGGVAVISLCVTLAGGGFLAACAGIVAVAAAYGVYRRMLTGFTVVVALLAVGAVVLPRLPRENPAVLLRSVAFYARPDGQPQQEKRPTPRLRRLQAALDLLGAPANPQNEKSPSYWVHGVGANQYQKNINRFYQPPYEKPARRTDDETAFDLDADERFTFSFFETVAVELGVPGLLAVLFLFAAWILSAGGAFARFAAAGRDADTKATLALAALGSGCGALVVSLFANPVIRGVGGPFALFFALALYVSQEAQEARERHGAP